MPRLSEFYGIIILMNFRDHEPGHFHVWYGDYRAIITIDDGLVKGEMPARALRMVLEWMDKHKDELAKNWMLAKQGLPLEKIEPLK
ncbi:MAG: DUF4160 domain-containing protein [Bacteroidetes bacterium]|nr:DUF4160 domain-containing protein [Bacteroidota bacterium]MCL2303589.1 DUF4160 domain-containing protein [Lentimicrobiaceae bacterium]